MQTRTNTTTQNEIDDELLASLAERLHWLKIGDDGVPELYLDNHMMQTFRMCPSRFHLDFIEGYKSKGGHIWFLDFGIAVHTCVEYYYIHRKDQNFDVFQWAGDYAFHVWNNMKMDEYYAKGSAWHHRNYEYLAGFYGFSALLMGYAQTFHQDNERFRVIGTELYFGKGKEVPLTTFNISTDDFREQPPFRLYLCGKIDLLMDDGYSIGPMDHKTSSDFMGKNPLTTYEIHDGMTGYVYAAKQLLKYAIIPIPEQEPGQAPRNCNKIWMNFLQVKPLPEKRRDGTIPTNLDRFKRLPLLKTDYQLEQYRLRQISTAEAIFASLVAGPHHIWYHNTMVCTNYMRHNCTYQEVHRQNSKESELIQLNSSFEKGPIWNPEAREHEQNQEEGEL